MASDSIAARLKKIRASLGGHSPRATSELLNLSVNTWGQLEKGENVPSGETLLKITAFGYSPTWILTGEGPMRVGSVDTDEPKTSQPSNYQPELMARVIQTVIQFYEEQGLPVDGAQIGQASIAQYDYLWDMSGPMFLAIRNYSTDDYIEYVDGMVMYVTANLNRDLLERRTAEQSQKRA